MEEEEEEDEGAGGAGRRMNDVNGNTTMGCSRRHICCHVALHCIKS